jgi:predicted nucleic acid-binding protein
VLRVTADTSLFISALNFGGKPEQFLRLAEAGAIQLFISDGILAEVGSPPQREVRMARG